MKLIYCQFLKPDLKCFESFLTLYYISACYLVLIEDNFPDQSWSTVNIVLELLIRTWCLKQSKMRNVRWISMTLSIWKPYFSRQENTFWPWKYFSRWKQLVSHFSQIICGLSFEIREIIPLTSRENYCFSLYITNIYGFSLERKK